MKPGISIPLAIAVFATPIAAQDVEKGARVYQDYFCYACHGVNGTNLNVPLANDMSGMLLNESVFRTFLRQRADLNPANASRAMPNYDASVLNDQQVRDLYAYIKTLQDDPPEVADDNLMQEIIESAKAGKPSGE